MYSNRNKWNVIIIAVTFSATAATTVDCATEI
jgi:hypothetical protein